MVKLHTLLISISLRTTNEKGENKSWLALSLSSRNIQYGTVVYICSFLGASEVYGKSDFDSFILSSFVVRFVPPLIYLSSLKDPFSFIYFFFLLYSNSNVLLLYCMLEQQLEEEKRGKVNFCCLPREFWLLPLSVGAQKRGIMTFRFGIWWRSTLWLFWIFFLWFSRKSDISHVEQEVKIA